MLTTEPTAEMIEKWKRIFAEKRDGLVPNRKTGTEVDRYFCEKYAPEIYDDALFLDAAEFNAASEYNAEKLQKGEEFNIKTYSINNGEILVGIDLTTGFIHVESENIAASAEIYDDLFVFRGLDEYDLKNFFLVAQYVELKERR